MQETQTEMLNLALLAFFEAGVKYINNGAVTFMFRCFILCPRTYHLCEN